MVVVGDLTGRAAAIIGCDAATVRSQRRVAPRSDESIAITVARRTCSPRGVPLPKVAQDEPEIAAARMNQQTLEDIGVAAQMGAAHSTVS
jgi:hypothetical protein